MDAFLIADNRIQILGSNRKSHSLSDACQDVISLEKLTDEQVCRFKSQFGNEKSVDDCLFNGHLPNFEKFTDIY